MSRCFFVKCEDYLDLAAFQQLVQRHLGQDMTICLKEFAEDYGGELYIQGQSTRGIEIAKEDDSLAVRIPLLADYADFFLAKLFLDIFCRFLGEPVLDEDGQEVDVRSYFSDQTVQRLREEDAKLFCIMLKNIGEQLSLSCPSGEVIFGRAEADHFIQCQLDYTEMVQRLTSYIGGQLWGDSQDTAQLEQP